MINGEHIKMTNGSNTNQTVWSIRKKYDLGALSEMSRIFGFIFQSQSKLE